MQLNRDNPAFTFLAAGVLALGMTVAACGSDGDNQNSNNNTNNAGNITTLKSGSLVADGAGGAPDATGQISLGRDSVGTHFIVLGTDFKQEMGPGDTQLILARTSDNVQAQRDADASSVSAAIATISNGFSGAATFEVPDGVDATAFDFIIVWCPTAGVNFGAAQLGESAGGTMTVVRQAGLVADGSGGAPDATGMVQVVRDNAGKLYVALGSDFSQEMGPGDTQLILARSADNVQAQRDADVASASGSLGTIPNGGSGAMQFEVPSSVDLDDFDYVIVWCPTAGVNFGAAELPRRGGSLVADGSGGAPDATGTVTVARDGDGMLTIEFGADFAQEMGPGDTQVFLTAADGNVNEQRTQSAASVSQALGTISNGATGAMSFAVPAAVNVDLYDHLIVWCPTAGVNFGVAKLQ